MWSETPARLFTWCRNKADLETGAFISPDKRDTLEGFLDLTLTLTGSSGSILLESTDRTDPVFISIIIMFVFCEGNEVRCVHTSNSKGWIFMMILTDFYVDRS